MRSLTIKSSFGPYEVSFIDEIHDVISEIKDSIIIIDDNVYSYYKHYFKDIDSINIITVNCVEDNKTLEGVKKIVTELVVRKTKINAKISIIGGGILQDLAGFAASIYCRGIEYTLIPTTLLSQCDSCIGGKTSINHDGVKNIVGTFYPPKKIYICTDFLKTLKIEDIRSGYGEIIKFYLLQHKEDAFIENEKDINKLVYESLNFKANVIEIDEFDKKDRKFLNFGHTLGHALEITSNYQIPHGTAVLFGIAIANRVSKNLGILSLQKQEKIEEIISKYVSHQKIKKRWFDFEILHEIIKLDKKNTGCINMVLLTNDDKQLFEIKSLSVIEQSIKEVYETFRLRN
jgi:3-dehydroquinate synthase